MKKIIIASKNPVKIKAALNGFQKMFPQEEFSSEAVSVPSGVSDQPMTNRETLQGACNRTQNAMDKHPEADFWVGIEGGVDFEEEDLSAFAWIVVRSRERLGKGRTGTFYLPQKIRELIREGKELGEADDIVFNKSNSKQQNGAVGLFTDNIIDRAGFYEHAVILALIPFKNQEYF